MLPLAAAHAPMNNHAARGSTLTFNDLYESGAHDRVPEDAPAMRSAPNAAGDCLLLCYESPQDNVARYSLYLERPTGERLRCISRAGGDAFAYLTLPERLQWVEGMHELALMHFRDKQSSRLHLLDIHSDDVVVEDGQVPGIRGYAAIMAQHSDCPQLQLRGKEADWLRSDGSLAATFHLDAAREDDWNAERLIDNQVGGLRFACTPNGRGERVGLLPRNESKGKSTLGRFALLEPGKKAHTFAVPHNRNIVIIEEEQGESPFGWGIKLGWVNDECFYLSEGRKRNSSFRTIRLHRSAQGAVAYGSTEVEVIFFGRHYCCEEGTSLILRAEDGSKLIRIPLRK